MSPNKSFLVLLFALIGICSNAQEWRNTYGKAQKAYESGDMTSALSFGQQSLDLYIKESGETSDNYTSILRLLQSVCYADGQFESGLAYAQKELAIRESRKDVQYAEALVQVSTFEQGLEKYDAAETSLKQALEIFQQFLKPADAVITETQLALGINAYLKGDEDVAQKQFDIHLPQAGENSSTVIQASYYSGLISYDKKNYALAIQNYQRVKKFYDDQGQNATVDYASLVANLANAYAQSSQHEQAEREFLAAQTVYETLNLREKEYLQLINARAVNLQKMGNGAKAQELLSGTSAVDGNPTVIAASLNNRAAISQGNGDFKQAEAYYREALSKLDKMNTKHVQRYAETIQNLAVLLSDQGNVTEAVNLLKESISLLSAAGEIDNTLGQSAKLKLANVFLKSGEKDKSKTLYKEVLANTSKRSLVNSTEWVIAMNGIGTVYQREGNLRSADSVFHDLISRYDDGRITRDFTYPVALNNYAALNQTQGSFLEAHNLFRRASNFIQKQRGVMNISYAIALENLAFVNLQMGLLQEAKPQIDSILTIYEKLLGKQSLDYASVQISLGKYYQSSGDYPSAEPCFKSAYQTVKNLKGSQQPEELVEAISALAIFYQTMGNYEEAEPLFKQALDVTAQTLGKNSSDYSTVLQNLATLYQMQGKLQLATPMLEQALAIDEKVYGQNHPQYAIPLKNLAAVYQKLGKLDNAQILLERALKISETVFGKNHPSYALTISNLAALYQDRGKFQEAGKAWEQSVALRKTLLGEQHPDYARSLYGLATNYFAQAKFKEANGHYKTVVAHYLKQITENFPSLSEQEKGAFYSKIKPVFESYQDFCIQYYKANPADPESKILLSQLYDVQLATKALLLNSSNKVRQSILASGDNILINTFRQWLDTKEQIVRFYSLSVEERKLEEDVSVLQQRANELEKSLSLKSSLFRQMTEKEITHNDVATALRDGEAAAEIIRIKRKFQTDSVYYVALIIKPGNPQPSLIIWPNGNALENRRFKFHRNSIKHHFTDTISYDHYWKPLADGIAGTQNVFLSCDGIFNKVNFNTLLNRATKRWVLDDFTISLVSNTKDIISRQDHTTSKGDVNLYGNVDFHLTGVSATPGSHSATRNFGFGDQIPMLPATEKEVDLIQKLIQSEKTKAFTFKMADANEINLKKTRNPAILHIATHGFFLNDVDVDENAGEAEEKFFNNPLLRSGILLAGAGTKKTDGNLASDEDGILTAYEAMNLYLDETDLVVLSACETGLGEVRNGEGVYGLQRSFMVAGSNAVMMSLWQVDDVATQELMVEFYKHWMEGQPKLDAFKKAQLLIKEKYKSPYYWGAFILVGI
jgi:CHAT domain-containing protein/tetratricopeptide (TPR) repeat protein